MSESDSRPPDFYCPNPALECPGKGEDLVEVREPICDDAGCEIGVLIYMACSRCGYSWSQPPDDPAR